MKINQFHSGTQTYKTRWNISDTQNATENKVRHCGQVCVVKIENIYIVQSVLLLWWNVTARIKHILKDCVTIFQYFTHLSRFKVGCICRPAALTENPHQMCDTGSLLISGGHCPRSFNIFFYCVCKCFKHYKNICLKKKSK